MSQPDHLADATALASDMVDAVLAEGGVSKIALRANGYQVGWIWIKDRSLAELPHAQWPFRVIKTEMFA